MQNSTLPIEENFVTAFQIFAVRLKLAFKLLTTPKAIIIIDSELDIFNMKKCEVISICAQICSDMVQAEIDEDKINRLVHELVNSD